MDQTMINYLDTELNRLDDVTRAIVDHAVNVERSRRPMTDRESIESMLRLDIDKENLSRISDELYQFMLTLMIRRYHREDVSVQSVTTDREQDHDAIRRILRQPRISDVSDTLMLSDIVNGWMADNPLSHRIHRHIRRSYMSIPSLRYSNLGDRVYEDLKVDGPPITDLNHYPIEFYRGLRPYMDRRGDGVPPSEQLLEVNHLSRSGLYGDPYYVRFAGDIPMFSKSSESIIHEYLVGSILNTEYSNCPFIMYTYGLSDFYADDPGDKFVQVLDNVSPYNPPTKPMTFGLFQWLDNSITLHEFAIQGMRPRMIDGMGNIVEVSTVRGLQEISMAILATFKYLFDKLGFVHGDIHASNIQLIRTPRPQVIDVPGYPGKYFNLDHIPIIIDYGFSSLIRFNIEADTQNVIVSPFDDRWAVQQQYVMDVDRFVRSLLPYRPLLGPEGNSFYDDLVQVLFASTVGAIISTPDLMTASEFTRTLRGNHYHRTVPHQMPTINPDMAIDWAIDRWFPGITSMRTTNEIRGDPEAILRRYIDQTPDIEIYSYPSAIVALQDPKYRSHTKIITPEVDDSIERMDCINEVSIPIDPNINYKFRYIYRTQIIDAISEFIDEHSQSPDVITQPSEPSRCQQLLKDRVK